MPAKRLLCVDDDPETLSSRKLLFESRGYFVVTTTSGHEALSLLSNGLDADLLMLDCVMPAMGGDELAQKLRQQHPKLPLVLITGVEPPRTLLRTVDAYIPKGADPEILLSTVSALLGLSDENAAGVPRRTILCVEDEELQLRSRRALFESAGYRVLEARSGVEAIEKFNRFPVDAVVMDYWLSGTGGNGTAVAGEMKRMRPRTPIMMLSGFASLPGETALVDAWMRKAELEPEGLINEVERLIKLRSTAAQLKLE